MKFNLDVNVEHEDPISFPLSVPMTEAMREEIKKIKRSSNKNQKIVNDLARQFFAQVIEKFHAGEFDESA
jgi:hypothetical protein